MVVWKQLKKRASSLTGEKEKLTSFTFSIILFACVFEVQ